MKRHIYIVFVFVAAFAAAQQTPQFSQYAFNRVLLNPAAAGSEDYIAIRLRHRSQWMGFEGAPRTQFFSAHTSLPKSAEALGLTVFNDAVGPVTRTGGSVVYAHHKAFKTFNLSLGLAGSYGSYLVDGNKIILHDGGDFLVNQATINKNNIPDLAAGFQLYNEYFFAGLGVSQLIKSKAKVAGFGSLPGLITLQPHFNLLAGGMFEASEDLMLEPSVYVEYVQANPIQFDINLISTYQQMFKMGASYRSGDAIAVIFGVMIKKEVLLAYSYDVGLSGIYGTNNGGSHEITLGWNFAPKGFKTGGGRMKARYNLKKGKV